MPCNCDHLKPTELESESRRIAKHVVYAATRLDIALEPWIFKVAVNDYGEPSRAQELTIMLCDMCNQIAADGKADEFIYNGKIPEARKLADWWDEHQEIDRKRIIAEEVKREKERKKKAALSKLTDEEKEALDL